MRITRRTSQRCADPLGFDTASAGSRHGACHGLCPQPLLRNSSFWRGRLTVDGARTALQAGKWKRPNFSRTSGSPNAQPRCQPTVNFSAESLSVQPTGYEGAVAQRQHLCAKATRMRDGQRLWSGTTPDFGQCSGPGSDGGVSRHSGRRQLTAVQPSRRHGFPVLIFRDDLRV